MSLAKATACVLAPSSFIPVTKHSTEAGARRELHLSLILSKALNAAIQLASLPIACGDAEGFFPGSVHPLVAKKHLRMFTIENYDRCTITKGNIAGEPTPEIPIGDRLYSGTHSFALTSSVSFQSYCSGTLQLLEAPPP
jgi:hypothetical protein